MTDTHTLRLSIDAATAQAGSRQFTGALEMVRKAVTGLDRDTNGAFTTLSKTGASAGISAIAGQAKTAAGAVSQIDAAAQRTSRQLIQTSLAAATAARTSVNEFARLESRLTALGDNTGVDRLTRDMARLQAGLATASTPLDVRVARSSWSDSAN